MKHELNSSINDVKRWRNLGLFMAGSLTMFTVLVFLDLFQSGTEIITGFKNLITNPQPEPVAKAETIILQQVREISELTTAAYTMQTVVPTHQERTFQGVVVGTTKLLYIAHGEVKAGINLSKIAEQNIQVSDQKIQIQLPPPQIVDSKIDVNRSKVYDYDRGWLGLGPDTANQLQTLAQRQALTEITNSACYQGILNQANSQAKLALTELFYAAGYQQVTIQTQPGNCPVVSEVKPQVNPVSMVFQNEE